MKTSRISLLWINLILISQFQLKAGFSKEAKTVAEYSHNKPGTNQIISEICGCRLNGKNGIISGIISRICNILKQELLFFITIHSKKVVIAQLYQS